MIANGDVLHSDAMFGGGAFFGLGTAIARKEHFGLYAEARLGLTLYDDATVQSYYNDLLEGLSMHRSRRGQPEILRALATADQPLCR